MDEPKISLPSLRSANTRSNRLVRKLDRPDASPLGWRRVLLQAAQDLYGTKDVQNVVTATYVWMADQLGHVTLGLFPTLLLCWAWRSLWPGASDLGLEIGYVVIAALVFGYWIKKEVDDFEQTERAAHTGFEFDAGDVWWNVHTALFFFGVGGAMAIAAFLSPWLLLLVVLLVLPVALRIGFWWLRRKLAFQQAGLPYLFRLANFTGRFHDGSVDPEAQHKAIAALANYRNRSFSIWQAVFGADEPVACKPTSRHLLITGSLGAGKTSLGVGIGTEFAFALGLGRYLSAAKLVELLVAVREGVDPHQMEFKDGRTLWPWQDCDLLVIDDVDAGAQPSTDGLHEPLALITPAQFVKVLHEAAGETAPLRRFAQHRTVWILGDPAMLPVWRKAIAEGVLGVGEEEVMVVEVQRRPDPQPQPAAASLRSRIATALAALGVVALLASGTWWVGESRWGRFEDLTPEQAFADGSFGLELAPLKYILVADKISARALQQQGGPAWPQRFGFLARPAKAGLCEADAPGNLPYGFSISRRLPGNATPVPVRFVGLSCAACHTGTAGARGAVLGIGSQTADVIAFTDAFVNAVLDPDLSAGAILDAYEKQCPGESSWFGRKLDAFLIGQWLGGLRAQSRDNASKYDLPYHGGEVNRPANIPTGPSRTRPFRSVVRNTLDFPGAGNVAYSKVPTAALQKDKVWSQFDGSVGDPVVRSMIAVFTSGASIAALHEPQIADNIRKAATYTLQLGVDPKLPTLAEAFPARPAPDPALVARGREVWSAQCATCHGTKSDDGWRVPPAPDGGPAVTDIRVLGTDAARLTFRYNEFLPVALATTLPMRDLDRQMHALHLQQDAAMRSGDFAMADWWDQAQTRLAQRSRVYPAGHRMAFPADEIALRTGYLNAPLPFVWLRAPYLHNGSVPTLRALIGLDERPERFCRGDAGYDTVAIGMPVIKPDAVGACPPQAPFLFDTTLPGNSNKGHLYPAATVGDDDRHALLAYLETQ